MNSLALVGETPLSLDPHILKNLHSYEDFLSTFVQLEQSSTSFSWLKADLLNAVAKKLGDNVPAQISRDLRMPVSTITNYIRTARAFPPEKRIINTSFSMHYHASFIDEYNIKTGVFTGEERFHLLETAADQNISVGRLADRVHEKKEEAKVGRRFTCQICGATDNEVGAFYVYSNKFVIKRKFFAHKDCFEEQERNLLELLKA